ncbi:hypothetical protein [Streptomyces hyaluromycini]|uniref:hypothetical protein n=1 Tax=Streptomyces hyaluromycini TaxID=1377993 RepID=UPI0011AE7AB2|nr:hypothetical protein [Streptomyces hyaluromycini]
MREATGNTGERKLRTSGVDTAAPQVSKFLAPEAPKLPKLMAASPRVKIALTAIPAPLMALTGPSRRLTLIRVTCTVDLAGSAPASASTGTAGAVFLILVGVGLLCRGTVIATDYKKAASRLYAKATSTQRNKAARVYGGPPAGPSYLRVIGFFQILGGTGVAAAGVYCLSR